MNRLLNNVRVLFPHQDVAPSEVAPGTLWIQGGRVHAYSEDPRLQVAPDSEPHTDDLTVVDLEGRWLLPAFCDAHLHLHYASQRRSFLELPPALSASDFTARVAAHAAGDGWVLGSGWRSGQLEKLRANAEGKNLLQALERVEPRRPLFLWSVDHHLALVNPRAREELARAGWSADSDDPALLVEEEASSAWELIPLPAPDLAGQIDDLLALGITSVGCFDRNDSWAAFEDLEARGGLHLRVAHSYPWEDFLQSDTGGEPRVVSNRLRREWVKIFLDGTLGSSTAWMHDDYSDGPGNRGVQRISDDELSRGLEAVAARGCSLALHAIGDRAVTTAVDSILRLRQRRQQLGVPARQDRIEHAELMDDGTFARIVEHQVALSVQPCHLLEDIAVAPSRWGDRSRGLLPLLRLQSSQVPLVFGTDFPIEPADPWVNLRAAMERTDRAGNPQGGFHPEERLGFRGALRAATSDAPRAHPLPEGWGSLLPGSPADFQILECADPSEVRDVEQARVSEVVSGGQVVWCSRGATGGEA